MTRSLVPIICRFKGELVFYGFWQFYRYFQGKLSLLWLFVCEKSRKLAVCMAISNYSFLSFAPLAAESTAAVPLHASQ